ncbi:16S rRNA (guanine(966)-N(2))-methyltransferase RsmD [Terriglobus aquaticus]|uniref:16S rRNA (Guanine(966)-N(2))-methyltransferase RsmD n=1 Tax=Terriglobus aquaticus TaxID=940139 RepID=A0ABW9KNQ2_9BACT|nr:16S rRNA (guanine(966)-N(2))-methyltransferase RsmD [Terriglobus aquaticus]
MPTSDIPSGGGVRVIAGTFRSRLLTAPRGDNTRPTSDRLRETLFNVLAPRLQDSVFVDLYAGSGAVGIEAASRGAAAVYFAETERAALSALRSNLATLGIRAEVESAGTATLLKRLLAAGRQAGIVFLDPPYEAADEYQRTLGFLGGPGSSLLQPGGIVVAEHRRQSPLPPTIGTLESYRTLKQGDAALTFFRQTEAEQSPESR